MIKKLVAQEPKAKGRNESEYLEQEVVGKVAPTQKQIDEFVKERNIPKEHLNDQLLERVKSFLTSQLKEEATDQWLAKKSRDKKLEIYLENQSGPNSMSRWEMPHCRKPRRQGDHYRVFRL